ncbi:MAG: hypothetical protein ACLPXU_07845 [Acidimicrobiales bacterium]
MELTLHTTDALSPELRHFRVGQGAVQGAARSLESVGGREAPPGSLAHAESEVGDHGIDRQARYQPIRTATTGDRRNVEPEMAKGPGPLGGFLETPSWSPRR